MFSEKLYFKETFANLFSRNTFCKLLSKKIFAIFFFKFFSFSNKFSSQLLFYKFLFHKFFSKIFSFLNKFSSQIFFTYFHFINYLLKASFEKIYIFFEKNSKKIYQNLKITKKIQKNIFETTLFNKLPSFFGSA